MATAPVAATNALIPRVVANAKRGIVCVSVVANRLTILDAEDDDEDDNDDSDGEGKENTDEDAHHRGHESDSIEVDL